MASTANGKRVPVAAFSFPSHHTKFALIVITLTVIGVSNGLFYAPSLIRDAGVFISPKDLYSALFLV